MSYECDYCNPKFFIIYGCCFNCGRKCKPPLFDPKGKISILDYEEIRKKWISDPYWDCGVKTI